VILGRRVVVVMPAYNAEKTLRDTVAEVPLEIVDDVVLVDDASSDRTAEVARSLGLRTIVHARNRGYGGNQKTCYREALRRGADVVVMVHPDYQYTPRLIPALAHLVASGLYDVALGSRVLGHGARAGGMPLYKYVANRLLTLVENLLLGHKLTEYHTGFRAFSRRVLLELPLEENSDDFVFDNQMLAQAILSGFRIGEVSCPTRYFAEASSIPFGRSVTYGFGVLRTALAGFAARTGLGRARFLDPTGRRLAVDGGGGEPAGRAARP
jgi:glycosyltransferase involved in cell wall biosynthesis